jgi:hypothetical protein
MTPFHQTRLNLADCRAVLIRRLREAAINANLDAYHAPGAIANVRPPPRRRQLIME